MKKTIKNYRQLLDRAQKITAQKGLDLSSDEDLSIGIMNLISIEEHLHFTAQKTGKDAYLDLLREVREMRKGLLKMIITDYEGEVWCISKHLLAASMRLMEVGTKQLGQSRKSLAKNLFKKAYQLYSLFWALNLGAIKTDKIKASSRPAIEFTNPKNPEIVKKGSIFDKASDLVRKLVDCCIE